MTSTGPVRALADGVRKGAVGTPYVVTETERGFDVSLDIVDARWFQLYAKAGLQQSFVHHVRVDADGGYSITDDARSLEWVAGVPRASFASSRRYGRVREISFRKIWALDERGRFGVVADYQFNSEEGRSLITEVAEQQGLRQRRGTAEKIGLLVGLIAAAGAVVTAVLLGVLALLGKF